MIPVMPPRKTPWMHCLDKRWLVAAGAGFWPAASGICEVDYVWLQYCRLDFHCRGSGYYFRLRLDQRYAEKVMTEAVLAVTAGSFSAA